MPELSEGDAIGPYVLEHPVNRGAFGRVWKAHDSATGRTVAIKVLASEDSNEERARARTDLERLAAAAARDSRHIVHVLSSGHEPVPHIVMEFVEGTNIRDELATRGSFLQEDVIRLGIEVADALRALHRVRVVHRDVKPANILLDREGEVRLTDFGIAKILGYDETVTLTQQNLLSAPYAAPEVWEGAPNPQSDLYAFGAVLFEMLAGRPPFQGDLMDLFRQHRVEEPDFSLLPSHTAPTLRELVHQCLAKTPGERPPNAEICIRMLERAREELRREPERFGPWLRIEEHPQQPWAWRCRNERTGEEAVVEVHFAEDEAYGEALRAALNANPRLTALGAEPLLGVNRLLLADDEGWPNAPDHNVAFWVARAEDADLEAAEELDADQLLRATETMISMIDTAAAAGVRLSIDADHAVVLGDGSVYLRRPGLPPAAAVEPRLGAFIFLRSLPMSQDAAQCAASARDLRDLRERLSRPPNGPNGPVARPKASKTPLYLALGLGAVAAVIVAVAALVAGSDSNEGQGRTPPPTQPASPVVSDLCGQVKIPGLLGEIRSACANAGPVSLDFDEDCPRGQVCDIVAANGGGVILRGNDQTIVFIDSNGDLALAREAADFSTTRLFQDDGPMREPVWSPDGRYIAYVVARQTGDALVTELRLLDTEDRGAPARLFTATDSPSTPEWQRRRISQPRWSPDGRTLYFLWQVAGGSSEVASIALPAGPETLDMRELRAWGGLPKNLGASRLDEIGGRQDLRFESISALSDGALLLEFCARDGGGCGLARWDGGGATVIAGLAQGARFVAPVQAGDHYLALQPENADVILLRIDTGGPITPITRVPIGLNTAPPDLSSLSLTLAPDETSALVGTSAGLRLISLRDGGERPLFDGRWANWYTPPVPGPAVSPPVVTPFATPTATPTPAPSPLPSGDADLSGEVVAASCATGQELVIRIRNMGPAAVDRGVFISVRTLTGTTRVGNTNVGLEGLAPGQSREVRTTYVVREAVQVVIDYSRDRQTGNNVITCAPSQ
jgi:hypothetical protein